MTDADEAAPTVAVVGGGAVGVTTAYDLAARGAEVTLYERDELAAESSGRAAGLLYDAYAEDVDAAVGARSIERFRAFDRSLPGFSFSPCPYVIAVREGDAVADGAGWTDPPSYVRALGERAVREGVAIETETAVALGPRTDAGREIRT